MPQLIVSSRSTPQAHAVERRFVVQKRISTVGTEFSHDFVVHSETNGLLFSLSRGENGFEILPGDAKLRLNGSTLHRKTAIGSCDRLEWSGGMAVFLASDVPALSEKSLTDPESQVKPLAILHNLAQILQGPASVPTALNQALDALVEMANAEAGYLLGEIREGQSSPSGTSSPRWKLLASRQIEDVKRSELFSDTILAEALRRREPVYVENIVGHPWSDVASVIQARIFSVACFPLCLGEEVLGAAFLLTRTPGKSIRRDSLAELGLLATQVALMLGLQSELRSTRRENARLKSLVGEKQPLLSETSPALTEIARRIRKLATTPLSVLILGETGTGKELAARELHAASDRSRAPFIAINCAAIPATLLESTLFGYERGAFTGAVKAHAGKFIEAQGGTLFLDEIGDLPLDLQGKILRVLQERTVEPLGGRALPIDVRLVAATHQDLEALIRQGRFRQDLFFRLNGAQVKLPPLRERTADIAGLATYFLRKSGCERLLSAEALKTLEKHSWPGNVRELEQVVTRAGHLSEGIAIESKDLELMSPGTLLNSDQAFDSLEEAQGVFTREYVERILTRNEGNRGAAAQDLGISERTLYRILAEHA
jgi:transcriptional regulator with GAF, ATPase, and Fis domain